MVREANSHRRFAISGCKRAARIRSAFTLIELVVVIGIIAFLAVVTLPAVSRMMEDSRLADTENKIKGLLRSARARAMDKEVAGLFFFLQDGVQRAAFIKLEQNAAASPQTADRFRVIEGEVFRFPPPIRVTPRVTVTSDPDRNAPDGQMIWDNDELASDDYRVNPAPPFANGPQNHRNFFTILFSKEGHLLSRPIVLIHDGDTATDTASSAPGAGEVPGSVTGLPVAVVRNYQGAKGTTAQNPPAFPDESTLVAMVNNGNTTADSALNFASVDGLLVYDDSVFSEFLKPDEGERRRFLIDTGVPYYISRQSGAVIAGPKGEGETLP